MSERPILFSGAMVRAILEGRKSQTRRLVKPQPASHQGRVEWSDHNPGWWIVQGDVSNTWSPVRCPYGAAGDRLWVREKLGVTAQGDCEYMADSTDITDERRLALCERHGDSYHFSEVKGIPSIFMPRWACRLVLEVTGVRVERLNEASEADILAEGVESRNIYVDLWNRLNTKRGYPWESNCWVWVLEFRRV